MHPTTHMIQNSSHMIPNTQLRRKNERESYIPNQSFVMEGIFFFMNQKHNDIKEPRRHPKVMEGIESTIETKNEGKL
jgi:hypothetical protein